MRDASTPWKGCGRSWAAGVVLWLLRGLGSLTGRRL
jgi:hypothetical protein